MSDMRCRTTFYTALGRLLLVDLGEDEDKFDQFMMPLTGITLLKKICLVNVEKNKGNNMHVLIIS